MIHHDTLFTIYTCHDDIIYLHNRWLYLKSTDNIAIHQAEF